MRALVVLMLALGLASAQLAHAVRLSMVTLSLEEGTICRTGSECRSFICVAGRCLGAAKACSKTAATRPECNDAVFYKASCQPGKYDKILSNLQLREGMAKAPREATCFNATAPGLTVARCVVVSDGTFGRYGLQCDGGEGSVLVRGLNDGDGPPGPPPKASAAGQAALGSVAAAAAAVVVAVAFV